MGLGRSRHGDDGVGPAVIRALRADFRPRSDVLFLDGDLGELDTESVLSEVCGLVMVGMIHTDGPPGILRVLRGPEILTVSCALQISGHAATFLAPLARQELLATAPQETVLIGVNGEENNRADAMAPAVRMAVRPAVLGVEVELARMGRPLTRLRRRHAFRDPWVRSPVRTQLCGA
jgi:hydrogenase maturation protease